MGRIQTRGEGDHVERPQRGALAAQVLRHQLKRYTKVTASGEDCKQTRELPDKWKGRI